MKLTTSTGDFSFYVDSITEKVKAFKGCKFKYINLEQTGVIPEFFEESDSGWLKLADDWGNAAAEAGITYVVSHAPCLNPRTELLQNPEHEEYRAIIRALRRSIEICHILSIPRIVVHSCLNAALTEAESYRYNTKFYRELLDLAEKYNILILMENADTPKTHFSTGKKLRDFIDHMDHPLLGACWDTAHGNISQDAREIGQYQNIITLGDKLKGMHISDNFGDCHHHSWPFAGIINFDEIMQGLLDVGYDGPFTFEASYTLLHQRNMPYQRKAWEHNGETVTKLLSPSIELKKKAIDLLYETGKYILETYHCMD